MQIIGSMNTTKLSENEFSSEWKFRIIIDLAYPPYLSDLFETVLREETLGLQLAIVPDKLHASIKFFLFLYGLEGRSGSKITFSASFAKVNSVQRINFSDLCLDLESSIKLLEIPSANGIFVPVAPVSVNYNSTAPDYVFKIKMQLHDDLRSVSSLSSKNVFPRYLRKNNRASATANNEEAKSAQDAEYPKDLIENLKALFTSGNMSDVKIQIGQDVLLAHKSILCARSPVFKRMMENDYLESSSNSITITDCSVLPFKTFLKYLYTGLLEDRTNETVMSLYALGDKYDVPALRSACSDILQTKLYSEPIEDIADIACEVLQLAGFHNDLELEDLAAGFIVSHFPVISSKQSWKDLMKSNFELTSKILSLVATGLQSEKPKAS